MNTPPSASSLPQPAELTLAADWVARHLHDTSPALPFSFVLDGKPSVEFLGAWKRETTREELDADRTRQVILLTDPKSQLRVRLEAVIYRDFPTLEWIVYVRNDGTTDSAMIEKVQALDCEVELPGPSVDCGFLLHQMRGSLVCHPDVPSGIRDHEPFVTRLAPWRWHRVKPAHGRPLALESPYFNLEYAGHRQGLIMALGWRGVWAAEFSRTTAPTVRIRAGQERSHFRLHPGEEIRSPLVVLQFWQGDQVRSQNVWRRWMQKHNAPRPSGRPFPVGSAGMDFVFVPGGVSTAAYEIEHIDGYAAERLTTDYWWVDAGWYKFEGVLKGQATPLQGYDNTGTWEADPERFPQGLEAVFEHAQAKGFPKRMLWFELERVLRGSWLDREHPEWLLALPDEHWNGNTRLLDFGNPSAWQWAVDRVDKFIRELKLDVYRQDFNIDPMLFWSHNETPDRQGVMEAKHVAGMIAFYQEIQRRYPHVLIDNCASGGHCNDVESLRYTLPLWRSDCPWDPLAQQGQTYGLASWIPYTGANLRLKGPISLYEMRGAWSPFLSLSLDLRQPGIDCEMLRRVVSQWRGLAECYLGDFYPLTSYSVAPDAWMAWQFDRPEAGDGIVQIFRRPASPFTAASFKLQGLEPDATYEILDLDKGQPETFTGEQLLATGLAVAVTRPPAAFVFHYRKTKESKEP